MVRTRGKWPGPTTRYCTAALKTAPSNKLITQLVEQVNIRRMVPKHRLLKKLGVRPVRVLNVFGMRAEESGDRSKRLIFERQERESSGVRTIDRWLPIHSWTVNEVWDRIRASGIAPHPIYETAGVSRSSCSFCILASKKDLIRAARLRPALARGYAHVEKKTGHRFKYDLSMEDVIRLAEDT